ncbi:MAG: F0F1 ATP synthase subunit B [Armatimonadetes bacterium]|nr:F0F1 ATP synthase subunit B [Armatimonadota bacterium]
MEILPQWQTLLTQILGFSLVVLVFWKFLWGPILGIIDARGEQLEGDYSAAEKDRLAAAELKSEYEKRLAGIETEMREKITAAAKEGMQLREEIISESRSQAEQVLARAQDEIGREKDKAVLEIKAHVADLAIGAAARLIEERLDDDKHKQLVDKFIDEIEGVAK